MRWFVVVTVASRYLVATNVLGELLGQWCASPVKTIRDVERLYHAVIIEREADGA